MTRLSNISRHSSDPDEPPRWSVRVGPPAVEHRSYRYTAQIIPLRIDLRSGDLQVLCTTRDTDGPFAGYDACVGSEVRWQEDPDARSAALRELAKASGVESPAHFETLDTYDTTGRDPRQWLSDNGEDVSIPAGSRVVSKAFLALLQPENAERGSGNRAARWVSVYDYLPWEDLRRPARIADVLTMLAVVKRAWLHDASGDTRAARRADLASAFGGALRDWNEEQVGDRTRVLLAAGLLEEGRRDVWGRATDEGPGTPSRFGEAMAFDHRLMVADALGRLRGKIKYVPRVLPALLGDAVTLPDLQAACEAIGGRLLHAANFRRAMVETTHLVRKLARKAPAKGRGPRATMYGFRADVARLRLDPGIRMPWLRLPPGALA